MSIFGEHMNEWGENDKNVIGKGRLSFKYNYIFGQGQENLVTIDNMLGGDGGKYPMGGEDFDELGQDNQGKGE